MHCLKKTPPEITVKTNGLGYLHQIYRWEGRGRGRVVVTATLLQFVYVLTSLTATSFKISATVNRKTNCKIQALRLDNFIKPWIAFYQNVCFELKC